MICGASRDKLRKVIGEAGLMPAGEDDAGNPMYRTYDLIVACYLRNVRPLDAQVTTPDPAKSTNPEDLPAAARKAWYDSEGKRLDLLERMRQLLPAADWEREAAAIYAEFAQFFQGLPDVLERDVDLTPHQVERLIEMLDRERQRFYETITTKRMPPKSDDLQARTG